MECGADQSPWNTSVRHDFYPINQTIERPTELSRLHCERDVLENGLANCVTYLQALRKKHAQIDRRLITNSSLPRKKKKKIQQVKRELEKEIKNRERDEQAFLINLQACKTNIHITETYASPSAVVPSTIPDYASSSTVYSHPEEAEPTELSWNGWTEDTLFSPFQKQSNNPFYADDIAPDERSEMDMTGQVDVSVHTPISGEHTGTFLTFPNAKMQNPLSPEAAVFAPQAISTQQGDLISQQLSELHLRSSLAITVLKMRELELIEGRRATDAGIARSRRPSSLAKIIEETGSQTWANTTPQYSPVKSKMGGRLRRSKTKSV
ncbi:hypothetical protein PtrSN002B_008805 [Pyrenophora tritici-repentis]|uniref:Uncharacterized protein n=2 Tax=Pyrenophora tritici-repentis TaxID=45151 RepID=A0A2W1FT61_9PLEO|nr:uncharacterized protein PTRG_09203 [Pyrenophora tritici-repentis Pt-1C-BFP]KAA8611239.1 hypothetical protein PtrV1_13900 [Pyrenophora tritici-repentis]EDU42254.1 predicted protein [Pyrenophora tritici-repentis Pt-1C-BFP]KAF7442154.1 hypothetical protein A1F99_130230 [Pyrenophora tritici-repentis]KAF7579484.1 hypothetical protein PtrM4_037240 [Pyrenophora tritici-repentis]KAG9378389.1 hypothetical protein A1F94_011505 [Pyrenophora tritici-repentis]